MGFIAAISWLGCAANVDELCSDFNCGCETIDDCSDGRVCFLSSCQLPGVSEAEVYIDILPPSDSGLLGQRGAPYPRDLASGMRFDSRLERPSEMRGNILRNPMAGHLSARRVMQASEIVVPSMLTTYTSEVQPTGAFSLPVMPGLYDITFTPDPDPDSPSAARWPPVTVRREVGNEVDNEVDIEIDYPPDGEMVTLEGRIRNGFTPILGARIQPEVALAQGTDVFAPQTESGADGKFVFRIPRGAELRAVTVGPSDSNPEVPLYTFQHPPIADGQLRDFAVDLPPRPTRVTLRAQAVDQTPLVGATIVCEGNIGDATTGRFTTRTTTQNDGTALLSLWAGSYRITVLPVASDTAAMQVFDRSFSTASLEETLVLPSKTRIEGRISSHSGQTLAAARVSMVRRGSPPRREFTTTTNAEGEYKLRIDPPTTGEIKYELTVAPDRSSGQPLYTELVSIGSNEEVVHNVTIPQPALAYGRVLAPTGAPLRNVIVTLYSAELSSSSTPLLIGFESTTREGDFVIPLSSSSLR